MATIAAPMATIAAPTATLSPAELQRYAGEYRAAGYGRPSIRVAAQDEGLQLTTPNGAHDARPTGKGKFEVVLNPSTTVRLSFAGEDSSMTLTSMDVGTGRTEPVLQRWTPVQPSAATLRSYPGVYVDVSLYISVFGEAVLIASRGLPATVLEPTPLPDRFDIEDYGVAFHRDEAGTVTHLTLEATRVKGMRFTRSDRR